MTTTQHRPMSIPAMRPGRRSAPLAARRPIGGAAGAADVVQTVGYDGASAIAVLDSFLMRPFLDGSQPFARSQRLASVREEATLRPAGTEPVRTVVAPGRTGHLVTGDGWTLLSVRWDEGGANVEVVAASEELARSVLERAIDGAANELPAGDPRVEVGFWHLTGNGAHRRELPITAQPWAEIRSNYPAPAAEAFDQLMALDGSAVAGRILLVHGPPGAKASAGQALSRLLNLTDGLLGQGRQVLVAITTNEDITRLHPAITRPGRCLACVEVGRLPYDQAVAWLGDSLAAGQVPGRGATLAELIALRDGTMPVGTAEADTTVGLYL